MTDKLNGLGVHVRRIQRRFQEVFRRICKRRRAVEVFRILADFFLSSVKEMGGVEEFLHPERHAKVEEDFGVSVLYQDLVSADLVYSAVER